MLDLFIDRDLSDPSKIVLHQKQDRQIAIFVALVVWQGGVVVLISFILFVRYTTQFIMGWERRRAEARGKKRKEE